MGNVLARMRHPGVAGLPRRALIDPGGLSFKARPAHNVVSVRPLEETQGNGLGSSVPPAQRTTVGFEAASVQALPRRGARQRAALRQRYLPACIDLNLAHLRILVSHHAKHTFINRRLAEYGPRSLPHLPEEASGLVAPTPRCPHPARGRRCSKSGGNADLPAAQSGINGAWPLGYQLCRCCG